MANISLTPDSSAEMEKEAGVFSFWCQRCKEMRQDACPQHGKPSLIQDKPILSRALASLPRGVTVATVHDQNIKGTFSKKVFVANSIFGPFIAPEVETHVGNGLKLVVDRAGKKHYLDYTEEEKCNWMMFVRPAEKWSDVNLTVCEMDSKIYFITSKCVQSDQEFRVAYSTPYARKYRLESITQESHSFTCEACDQSFGSHIAKVGHQRASKCRSILNKLKQGRSSKAVVKRGRPAKVKVDVAEDKTVLEENNSVHKLMKKSRTRLSCPVCHMTFDQDELMQLHMLSHTEDERREATDNHKEQEQGRGIEGCDKMDANCVINRNDTGERDSATAQGPMTHIQSRTCPACLLSFDDLPSLLQHVNSEHRKRIRKPVANFVETQENELVMDIERGSSTGLEVLEEGIESASVDESQMCPLCKKEIRTPGALSTHIRSHSRAEKNYYGCFLCDKSFSSSRSVLEHVRTHAVDGYYYCPKCPHRKYDNWKKCRKHINSLHSGKEFPCTICSKVFSRADKLRLHAFTHTDVKEFMCDQCGRQFNRKDKLLSHIRRLHEDQSELTAGSNAQKKYIARLANDYHKYIFKCKDCSRGFKRRGMLVNHLAKAHPSISPSSIPELNIPLLRTQRDFYCTVCDKTYKSSTKRKMHILKNHPGCVVPPGHKSKDYPGLLTFSEPVANITTLPYACNGCHKEYANKAKLAEHKRRKHLESEAVISGPSGLSHSDVVALIHPLDTEPNDPMGMALHAVNLTDTDRVDNSDLLTHAMSVNELQPSIDFPAQTSGLSSNSVPLELRLLPSSIDLSSLQLNNLHGSGLSLTVANSCVTSQTMPQAALSQTIDTPNLNSIAPNNSPRTAWQFQYKLN
ncbi:PR domain zinc finger protein 10-like [Watersipora subatra]|uniref:PR domain zinc finger protein 10-like n=1 Tax=Watersipora subatra TaxID=2589382 RepID=UPI00355C30FB